MNKTSYSFFDLKHVLSLSGKAKFVTFYVGKKKCYFLLDTGASISVIKKDALPSEIVIQKHETVINGICGQINSTGYVQLTLSLYNKQSATEFVNKYHVFETVPLKADGILGLDFLCCYASNINLDTNVLTLYKYGMEYSLPLHDAIDCSSNNLFIPARSETIHYIPVDTHLTDDFVVCSKELAKEIYLAGSIVTPKNNRIPVKILNTSEQDVVLSMFQPELHSLNNYYACEFNKNDTSSNRAKLLLEIIKLNHLNGEEQTSIRNLCSKYADVFFLSGDKLTTTNIYEQTITIKPNTSPVYVKQYRVPQSLKKR